jgi:hypothetical protein
MLLKSGLTTSSGRVRLAVLVTAPMPGMVRRSRFDLARVVGQQRSVLARQDQDVLFVGAAEPDLDLHTGQGQQCLAQGLFHGLLLDAATLLARRQVDGQRRLAHFRRPARREGIAAGGAAADRGIDHLHVRIARDDVPCRFRRGARLAEGAAGRQRDVDLRLGQIVRGHEPGR